MPRLRVVIRFSGPRTVASRYLLYSLATHAFLLVVLVLLPSFRGTRAMTDTLVVDLVSFPSPAPPAAPVRAPAPPQPAPPKEPEGVRVEASAPEVVPDDPPPVEKPKPEAEPEPPPRTDDTPPAASGSDPAPGEPSGPPGDSGATITAMEGAGDFELGWYRSSVTAALFAQWRKPILEGITEPREVRVTFQIQRDGRVTDLRVEGSSGVPSLDRSALRAVADAAPLPPLPPNWRAPTLSAGFVFRLYPE